MDSRKRVFNNSRLLLLQYTVFHLEFLFYLQLATIKFQSSRALSTFQCFYIIFVWYFDETLLYASQFQ